MSSDIYYVYVYRNPCTNIPFYVGLGKGNRWRSHINEAVKYKKRNPQKEKMIRDIIKTGRMPVVEFVFHDIGRDAACREEIRLIEKYKRTVDGGSLTNVTLGGDGGLGVRRTKPEIFKFVRVTDGFSVLRTRAEMIAEFGVSPSAISAILSGTIKSGGGWCVDFVKQKLSRADKQKRRFLNINGGEFYGTRSEFAGYIKTSVASIQNLFTRKGSIVAGGWYLPEHIPSKTSIERVKLYEFTDGCQVVCMTVGDFCNKFNLNNANVRRMIQGHRYYKQVKGWRLVDNHP